MAEVGVLDDAVAEHEALSLENKDSAKLLKELKEDHEANLSAALEGVLKECSNVPETEKNQAETPSRITPEDIPPKSSSPFTPEVIEVVAPSEDLPNFLVPNISNSQPMLTESQETENHYPLEGKHPTSLYPIPEHTPPPTAPERAGTPPTTTPSGTGTLTIPSEPTPPESEPIPESSHLTAESVIEPARIDNNTIPVETFPESATEVSALQDVIDIKSLERLSIVTAINESASLGSDNDLFVSTKASNENTVDPKPEVESEPESNQTLIALQKIMPPNLSEDALHLFKAASEKLFKEKNEEPNVESHDFDTSLAKSATGEKQDVIKSSDIVETTVVSPVKENVETVEEASCKIEEKMEIVVSSNLNQPPITIDTPDEPLIDVVDFSPTEVHTSLTEVQEKTVDVKPCILELSQPEQTLTSTEVEVPKLAITGTSDVPNVTEDLLKSESAASPPEKPPTEVPIRQRDCSKDPAKKPTSKTAVKTVKPVAKSATRAPSNPQVSNTGQNGTIAATASSSATSALSPRSEKSIKQIKSPRPVSASSTRGYFGDLSSPVLGGVATALTGPQRVAAARAAAAASGVKRKVSGVPSLSAPLDGVRSPREKLSVTSTCSNASAVTASNVSSTGQKKTSAVSGSATSATLHQNAPRRGAAADGNRMPGHGGPPHLGIHASHQKLKNSNDIKSLEETYSAVLKSFVDAKKEIKQKTKLAFEMFSEVEKLRHIASTKFGKDLPLTEDTSGLAEVAAVTRPAAGAGEQIFSDENSRTIAAAEVVLKTLTSQRNSLLNEALQHHANLLACCCEATGDEKSPLLFSEKEFADQIPARISEVATSEQNLVAEVLQVLRTSLSDLDATKASIRDLRSQLELLNQENSTLTSSLSDCTKELEESRTEFGKVTARKNAAEKETKILRLKLKEAETKAAAEEQKCKDLTNQLRSLEDKLRSKDSMQEQRIKETERKLRERITKEQEENQRRMSEALKQQQLKESKLEATCQQLDSKLGSVTQLLEIQTKDKERIEEELKATTEKLSRIAMHRSAKAEIPQSEREDILQRLNAMIAGEDISNGPKLREELQALADLLNERERLISEKDSEIKRLKDSCNESGDSIVSKEDYQALQETLKKLSSHNHLLEQELSKMVQAAAKRDRVMSEQEKVLVIRDQLIALLQGSNHPAGNAGTSGANVNPVAIQKRMLELQTTVERQTVRIKALEAQLAKTEEHQDGLQNLRTRYERRIAQLERALSDHRVAHRSETITKLRTLLQNNLGPMNR